jgi:hypothetical protein
VLWWLPLGENDRRSTSSDETLTWRAAHPKRVPVAVQRGIKHLAAWTDVLRKTIWANAKRIESERNPVPGRPPWNEPNPIERVFIFSSISY